jgi:hypothetical protein
MKSVPALARFTTARWRIAGVAVLAIAFVMLSLSCGFIRGDGAYWASPVGDAAQGEIGWFYFARDAWRFPLFDIRNYHLPEGSNLLLSDGIPLLALIAKPIYRALYPSGATPPIYVGYWVAACLALQVLMALRILSSLGIADLRHRLAGAVLFCYVPLLFLRFGQFSLLGQFIVLLSLGGYIRSTREQAPRVPVWTMLVPAAALWLHPYLAAMSALLSSAAIIEQYRRGRLEPRGFALRASTAVLSALAVMWLGGGYLANPGRGFRDYGIYSLNLLSPFVPTPNSLSGTVLGTSIPSVPGLHQWEGSCYLGAGVLFLAACALPAFRDWKGLAKRHAVLLLVLAASLVFAISHRIGLGPILLAHVPLPDGVLDLLSKFRASGRFVWIGVYVFTAFLCLAVVRSYSPAKSLAVLVLAALLQLADVLPMQTSVRAASRQGNATIHQETWSALIAQHARIRQFPSFECGGIFAGDAAGEKWRALEIDYLVARSGKPNNSAYLARYTKDCDAERTSVLSDILVPGTLYLYRNTDDVGAMLARYRDLPARCATLDDVVVCSASADLSSLR